MRVTEGYTGSGSVIPVDAPTYLVELWSPEANWTPDNPVWCCGEYEFTDCDATEALEWAASRSDRFVAYAVFIDDSGDETHVRLAGIDPTGEDQIAS